VVLMLSSLCVVKTTKSTKSNKSLKT